MSVHLDKENSYSKAFETIQETSAESSSALPNAETSTDSNWGTSSEWHLNAPRPSKRMRGSEKSQPSQKSQCLSERTRSGLGLTAISNVYYRKCEEAYLASLCVQGAIDLLKRTHVMGAPPPAFALELLQDTTKMISNPVCKQEIVDALYYLVHSHIAFYSAETIPEWLDAIDSEEKGVELTEQSLASLSALVDVANAVAAQTHQSYGD